MKSIILILSLVVLVSCRTQYQFLSVQAIPKNPTVVVIPASDYLYQIDYANALENYLIGLGIKVIDRPLLKSRSIMEEFDSDKKSSRTTKEAYQSYEETNADFIIQTFEDQWHIRIINNKTKEVVASLSMPRVVQRNSVLERMHELFYKLGFEVNPIDER